MNDASAPIKLHRQQTRMFSLSGDIANSKSQFRTFYKDSDPIMAPASEKEALKKRHIEHLHKNYKEIYQYPLIGQHFYSGEDGVLGLYHVYTADCYKRNEEAALTFEDFVSLMDDLTITKTYTFEDETTERRETFIHLLKGERKLRYAGYISESVERVLDRELPLHQQQETVQNILYLFYRREALEKAWTQALIDNTIFTTDSFQLFPSFFHMTPVGIGVNMDTFYFELGFHDKTDDDTNLLTAMMQYLSECHKEERPREKWEPNHAKLAADVLSLRKPSLLRRLAKIKAGEIEPKEPGSTPEERHEELSESEIDDEETKLSEQLFQVPIKPLKELRDRFEAHNEFPLIVPVYQHEGGYHKVFIYEQEIDGDLQLEDAQLYRETGELVHSYDTLVHEFIERERKCSAEGEEKLRKSESFLQSILTAEQVKTYKEKDYILEQGRAFDFIVFHSETYNNILRVPKDPTKPIESLCLHAEDVNIPHADSVATILMHIRTGKEEVINEKANFYPLNKRGKALLEDCGFKPSFAPLYLEEGVI